MVKQLRVEAVKEALRHERAVKASKTQNEGSVSKLMIVVAGMACVSWTMKKLQWIDLQKARTTSAVHEQSMGTVTKSFAYQQDNMNSDIEFGFQATQHAELYTKKDLVPL